MNNQDIFDKQGYCIVKSCISTELRDFVTQYALFDEMQNFSPEGAGKQVANAHSKYADPAMETMLLHLHKVMQENTGLKLHPTYSYYRIYRPGDKLEKHTDRPSCEISATLCFNYDYDNSDTYTWPIYMDGNSVNLMPGDLVIYRGCDLEHWRDQFNLLSPTAWHLQGFFHYVEVGGKYDSYKFDRRESVGLPSVNQPISNSNNLSTNLAKKDYITYTK
jgi:hypothetical protein